MKNKIKLYLLKKLWIWWVNEKGTELRGTQKLEEIEKVLFKKKK